MGIDLTELSLLWRGLRLLDFLEQVEGDSEEVTRTKRWVASFLIREKLLQEWTNNPHSAGPASLATMLLGAATTKKAVVELYDCVAMDNHHPGISSFLREHFRGCQDCRIGVFHELRPYFPA